MDAVLVKFREMRSASKPRKEFSEPQPERGHVVLDEKQRAQIEAAGKPKAVDYARQEGA